MKKTAQDIKDLINAEPTKEQKAAATRAAKQILSDKGFRESVLETIRTNNPIDHMMTQICISHNNVTFYAAQQIQKIQEQRGASEQQAATFAYQLILQTVTEERQVKQS